MNVYYLGHKGSFSHEAGAKLFQNALLKSSSSIEDVLDCVKKDNNSCGIVPVENTLEGMVVYTLDMLFSKKLASKQIQKLCVSQFKKHGALPWKEPLSNISQFRYYIDYIDTLIFNMLKRKD